MSRDIKFRGYDYKYSKWYYGSLFIQKYDGELLLSNGKTFIVNGSGYTHEVDRGTIGQYTGLKDKNGVEIYEGDIIDINQTVNGYNQFVIGYKDYKFAPRFYYQEKNEIRGFYPYDLDEFFEITELEEENEVIGNIYEKGISDK